MKQLPLLVTTLLLAACSAAKTTDSAPPTPTPAPTSDAGADATADGGADPCLGATPRTVRLDPKTATTREVQTAFVSARPGDLIELGEGTFKLDNTLSLSASCVTVRGAGREKTILDFATQAAGSDGLYGDHTSRLVLEGFSVRDARGNAIKVLGGEDLVFRGLGTSWTGPDPSKHGAYGLYPIQSKRVLIEDCVATDASDSGIYVGQSSHVVVRRNRAERNVAGIEIENTFFADVYENVATGNTAGILVFDLPGLPQVGGHSVRVFKNELRANNTKNFAPKGNTVGIVPAGVGFFVMANHDVEVFENTFTDNVTFHSAVVSYFVTQLPINDPKYDPYPSRVYLHDNKYVGGGDAPDSSNELGQLLLFNQSDFPGKIMSRVMYDGVVDDKRPASANPMEICVKASAEATFANVHLDTMKGLDFTPTFDAEKHACTAPVLAPVTWPGLK